MIRTTALVGFVGALLFAATAHAHAPAAGAPAPAAAGGAVPLADALQGAARTAYESAKLLAQNHDFNGALAEFKHAYELSKDPRLLFNMAICQKELHHYARMRAMLEQYLRDGAQLTTAESQSAAQDALAAIKPLVASIHVTVSEEGAEVSVDGEVAGTSPLKTSVAVDLGKHTVTVKKNGFDAFEQSLDMPGGTEATVAVTLKAQQHVGQLVVSSDPAATVVVDGKEVGKGRFEGAVAAGPHDVSVSGTGKKTYTAHVELRDGETRTMDVTLEEESHGMATWPWIVGGAVAAAGVAVGGYFLFKPQDTSTDPPMTGKLGVIKFQGWP
jgi:hypothetical protein